MLFIRMLPVLLDIIKKLGKKVVWIELISLMCWALILAIQKFCLFYSASWLFTYVMYLY